MKGALAIVLTMSSVAAAQNANSGGIHGVVRDRATGIGVPHAPLSIDGAGISKIIWTDDDGTYEVASLAPGTYNVVYAPSTLRIGSSATVGANQSALLDLDVKTLPRPSTSATAGGLVGLVRMKDTGEAMVGATVMVTGACAKSRAVITDEWGLYAFGDLPPGEYDAHVYYNDAETDRPHVVVAASKTAWALIKLDPYAASVPPQLPPCPKSGAAVHARSRRRQTKREPAKQVPLIDIHSTALVFRGSDLMPFGPW